jgi:hypothetical protein
MQFRNYPENTVATIQATYAGVLILSKENEQPCYV